MVSLIRPLDLRMEQVREDTGLPVYQQHFGDPGDEYHLRMRLANGSSCRLTPGNLTPDMMAMWLDAFAAGVAWERGLKDFAPADGVGDSWD